MLRDRFDSAAVADALTRRKARRLAVVAAQIHQALRR